jgi:ABC-type transport system involved in multi-copper enzyme maturation permease subunit
MTGRALDFVRTVARLARTDLTKLSRYWVVVAGYAAILFIAVPGAVLAHWAERALRITSDSGYDFAINLMVRYVDLTTPILYVMICIVFAIDVANATVKYILTRPVTRMELLASKYVTGLAMAFATLALLWGVALGAGAWFYGLGDLIENGYVIFEAGYVWRQIAASTAFLLVGYAAIASLAIMVSTWSSTMGGAVIVGLILFFFFQTLAIVPATLGMTFSWRGEDHVFAWSALGFPSQLYVPLTVLDDLPSGIPIASWWTFELGQFAVVCGSFFLAFLAVAAWGVRRRDFVL